MTVYAADWLLPVDAPPLEGGAVAVEEGRIAAVGIGVRRLARARTLHTGPGDIRYEKGVAEWHELIVAASRARVRMLEGAPEPIRELA